ncbi:NADH-quinone oxidoreductase subunit C [Desulforhabdus amnigena]|jgi:NADH-quinone oxidoreductase subunit C|uniref:NADH:ubiquinone oxidoreductase 30kDa subunit domain-containing protein n=1 Tax=Desulforhabdus amnigena TaxID=40218 RepID=A0A9W6FSV9_9BACT|nr:NADH-quinone oxidoreductase subunit C [Desulforhabdus amnigena]NLJ26915.1 NADH-quinone oxidoreductase subunit C [Deltaproteobacteria bacterium]GLI34503.1 hypothetical protein DAMNIGENAA_19360 [Desulforhabdus amnigena]
MGKVNDVLEKLQKMLPGGAVARDEGYRAGVVFSANVPQSQLREVATVLNEMEFYLESCTAIDFQDTFELVYHFNCYEPRSRFAVRVLCGHDQAVPTVCDIFKTAKWQEREIHEFFGISFVDNPDLRRLLLPEDADFYPLKKTFGKVNAYRRREEIYG